MKIVRNGVEITLTEKELLDAYYEQQENFDLEDIKSEFSGEYDSLLPSEESESYGISKKEFQDLIPDMATRYRRYLDRSDYLSDVIYDIRQDAISDVILEMEKEKITSPTPKPTSSYAYVYNRN